MAAFILEASTLSLGGTDVSALTQKIELTIQTEKKDVTTFVGDGANAVIGGQESGSLKVTFIQDLSASGLDEDMWAALKGRQPIAFAVKLDDAAISTTNPCYTGYCLVDKWVPLSGAPGDAATVEADFPTSGATTRDVTP